MYLTQIKGILQQKFGEVNVAIFVRSQHNVDKYSVETMSIYIHRGKHKMINLFKLWAAINVPYTWNSELEKYINLKKPTNHAELELVIREFERKMANA